jgi:hypothetical protein
MNHRDFQVLLRNNPLLRAIMDKRQLEINALFKALRV